MVNIKKISQDKIMKDIVSLDKYCDTPDMYPNKRTTIEVNGMALPVIDRVSYEAGIVGIVPEPDNFISRFNAPSEENRSKYVIEGNKNVVDFSDTKNYKEYIEKSNMVKDLDKEILTNGDNITKLKVSEKCTPAMAGLKEAINSKNCDINSYEQYFDGNFANNRRILFEDSVTLPKLATFGNAYGIKISLTFEDENEDVANPMGKKITKVITGGSK